MRNTAIAALIGLAIAAAPASAAEIVVTNAWFRALPGNLPGAGYFTLRNTGKTEAVLTGAASPACGMLSLHKSESMSGMSNMGDVEQVSVPPGGKARFSPGGYHLMCMGPTPALHPGAAVVVELTFADGTRTTTRFTVKNAAGK